MLRTAAAVAVALAATSSRAADPEIKFEKYRLPNGLTVILSEDHRLPQVAVDIWYHVGAANQTEGRSGFAHLFEHMMFSGSKHIQPSSWAVVEKIGVRAGAQANGTTNFDRTNYFEVVPSNELPTALWVESDRMGYLLDTLDQKKLEVQRDVVSNERRQSYENVPYGTAYLRTCELLFPKPHPYNGCTIGDIAEIQAASAADVRAFFRQFYGPQNASLALVGDFDPATARALIEKYFGPIPAGPEVKVPDFPQPQLTSVVRERIEDRLAELPRLMLLWPGVRTFSEDEAAGDLLADVLGSGRTSRLYKALVFDRRIASGVAAEDPTAGQGGYFEISVTAAKGHTLDELGPVVQGILDDVRQNGVRPEELERARRNRLADMLRGVERIGGFGGKADQLNAYQTYLGDPGYLARDLARYRAVTQDAVKAFAAKYLSNDRRIELSVVPAAAKTASAQGGKQP